MKTSAQKVRLRLMPIAFRITTFRAEVRFVTTKERFIEIAQCKPGELKHSSGATLHMGGVVLLGVFDNSVDTLVHEITHAAFEILDCHSVRIDSRTQEVLCLLVEDLFNHVLQGARRQ